MKTIFITGATENTGFVTAKHFAKNGYNVAISSRSLGRAERSAKQIELEFGVNARGYALDLKVTDEIQKVFSKIYNDFGSIDVFVANSANLGVDYGAFNTNEEDFDDIMDVNAKGTFFCCQNAAKIMKEQGGGNIVIIGSVQANGAVRGRTIYSMTKAALSSLTKNLAFELSEYNIRVNNVVAGAIHSVRWDSLSEEETQRRRGRYPLGKEASEQDIANAIYYLATDLSSATTGIDLLVDSGLSVCLLPYEKQI